MTFRPPLLRLPWWVYLTALVVMLWATWSTAQESVAPLALCQQELSGWKQISQGQVAVLQVENQRLIQQVTDLRKQVADLEAKAKAPEPKK